MHCRKNILCNSALRESRLIGFEAPKGEARKPEGSETASETGNQKKLEEIERLISVNEEALKQVEDRMRQPDIAKKYEEIYRQYVGGTKEVYNEKMQKMDTVRIIGAQERLDAWYRIYDQYRIQQDKGSSPYQKEAAKQYLAKVTDNWRERLGVKVDKPDDLVGAAKQGAIDGRIAGAGHPHYFGEWLKDYHMGKNVEKTHIGKAEAAAEAVLHELKQTTYYKLNHSRDYIKSTITRLKAEQKLYLVDNQPQ